MSLDPDSATPLYIQLADLLRAEIESGKRTGRLPSVKTLGQDFGVSHITAEKALTLLKDEGLAISVIGKGYYVAQKGQQRRR